MIYPMQPIPDFDVKYAETLMQLLYDKYVANVFPTEPEKKDVKFQCDYRFIEDSLEPNDLFFKILTADEAKSSLPYQALLKAVQDTKFLQLTIKLSGNEGMSYLIADLYFDRMQFDYCWASEERHALNPKFFSEVEKYVLPMFNALATFLLHISYPHLFLQKAK